MLSTASGRFSENGSSSAVSEDGSQLHLSLNRQSGFSLLEMSIVLLIMGLLLGSLLRPFGTTLVEKKRRQTETQLYLIREALVGYASANHRLPCPLTDSSGNVGNCAVEHGYVPAATLGIDGRFDSSGFLVDSWGSPVRYSVSNADADDNGQPDFTTAGEMQYVGIQLLQPNFEVCTNAVNCNPLRANQVPVVISSNGPSSTGSLNELENTDGDNRFVSGSPDSAGTDQFDDIVVWLSENILYSRLIKAGVLP